MNKLGKVEYITKYIAYAFSGLLFLYIVLGNFAPFGIKTSYSSFSEKDAISLSPNDRVIKTDENGVEIDRQISDLIYFSTKMLFKYDTAKVKISYKNRDPEQVVYLGFQDQDVWHYESKLVDNPLLDKIDWQLGFGNLMLHQRKFEYFSVPQFLDEPPQGKLIGSANLDSKLFSSSNIKIEGYLPSKAETVINTPLRGKHILYAYLENEPFVMTIQKQDMNWYEDEDAVTVSIYKDDELVYEATGEDDGITDASKVAGTPLAIYIENPGPGLPENGVYKIVIDANGDTVIKSIRTNLSKIVFESPIFPVENSAVYSDLVDKTVPTKVYTDAKYIKAMTYHNPAVQNISIYDPTSSQYIPLAIYLVKTDYYAEIQDELATIDNELRTITIPESDVILSALPGYFSFSTDQYFQPTPFQVLPINAQSDVDMVDYILADYKVPQKRNGWSVSEIEFDLSNAVIKDGKLSWLIKAPDLEENGNEILIKDIEVEFIKKPIIKLPFKK